MSSLEELAKLPGYNDDGLTAVVPIRASILLRADCHLAAPAPAARPRRRRHWLICTQAPTEEQKADALKYATEVGGFPPLAFWSMPQFTPAMVKLFTDKEKLVNEYPMTYITNPEKEIIYAVVSAANNCEMCLSFHAMGMAQTLSPEDCKLIVDGGLPTQNERARTIAIAAKYAVCHKGILLEREAAHLASMGVSKEMYGEILFLAGQITANNMFFVYLIQQGVAVEEPLQAAGPFATTVYAKKE